VDSDACCRAGVLSMVCVPLRHAGRVTGVLTVHDPRPNAFLKKDVATLDLLSGAIGAYMTQATNAHKQHDVLTGLPNRQVFEHRLAQELARVTRHGGNFTLGRLDLDWGTPVDDEHGRAAADRLLRAVAGHLDQLRDEDSAYRLGPNEFAVVLIEASDDAAEAVLERIAKAIKQGPGGHRLRLAWGAAIFQTGDDAVSLVARAELALYDAKRALAA
jgi:diguanylate cyclase (GGDEF)-like protein